MSKHGRVPTLLSTMHLYPIDGAVHDIGRNDTAFSYRESNWAEVIVGVDPDPANKALITDWCKRYFDALHPHGAGGAYVNFMMDEGQERVQATYRDNYERLARSSEQRRPGQPVPRQPEHRAVGVDRPASWRKRTACRTTSRIGERLHGRSGTGLRQSSMHTGVSSARSPLACSAAGARNPASLRGWLAG